MRRWCQGPPSGETMYRWLAYQVPWLWFPAFIVRYDSSFFSTSCALISGSCFESVCHHRRTHIYLSKNNKISLTHGAARSRRDKQSITTYKGDPHVVFPEREESAFVCKHWRLLTVRQPRRWSCHISPPAELLPRLSSATSQHQLNCATSLELWALTICWLLLRLTMRQPTRSSCQFSPLADLLPRFTMRQPRCWSCQPSPSAGCCYVLPWGNLSFELPALTIILPCCHISPIRESTHCTPRRKADKNQISYSDFIDCVYVNIVR